MELDSTYLCGQFDPVPTRPNFQKEKTNKQKVPDKTPIAVYQTARGLTKKKQRAPFYDHW